MQTQGHGLGQCVLKLSRGDRRIDWLLGKYRRARLNLSRTVTVCLVRKKGFQLCGPELQADCGKELEPQSITQLNRVVSTFKKKTLCMLSGV